MLMKTVMMPYHRKAKKRKDTFDDDLFEEANNLSGDSDDDIGKDKSDKK